MLQSVVVIFTRTSLPMQEVQNKSYVGIPSPQAIRETNRKIVDFQAFAQSLCWLACYLAAQRYNEQKMGFELLGLTFYALDVMGQRLPKWS